jgi:hypothetical protein
LESYFNNHHFIYLFFSLYVFGEPAVHFRKFSSVAPHRGQPAAKCHPWVATHQEIGSQLWAGETPDSNPGLQDNSHHHHFIPILAKVGLRL